MKLVDWFFRLFQRGVLVPYPFGAPECPSVKVGDTLVAVLENESYDIIAGLCGMNGRVKAGTTVRWKVKELFGDGNVLIQAGTRRTILGCLKWEDGNLVRCVTFPLATVKLIRFYKLQRA